MEFTGEYEFAVGSVRGARRFSVDTSSYLCGQSMSSFRWQPGVNVAECRYNEYHNLPALGNSPIPRPPSPTGLITSQTPLQFHSTQNFNFHSTQNSNPIQGIHNALQYARQRQVANNYLAQAQSITWEADVDPSCMCGYWAYWDYPKFGENGVVGIIEGWGKTLIGDEGFRCQKAKIVALVLPDADVPPMFRRDRASLVTSAVFAVLCTMYLMFFILSLFTLDPEWSDLAAAGLFSLASGVWFGAWKKHKDVVQPAPNREFTVSFSKADKIRKLYPDVPVYRTLNDAKKDFPLGEIA